MCFVEVIDTAGQGEQTTADFLIPIAQMFTFTEEYATLRDQWVRYVYP